MIISRSKKPCSTYTVVEQGFLFQKGGDTVKIVVVKSPRFFRRILRMIFKMK